MVFVDDNHFGPAAQSSVLLESITRESSRTGVRRTLAASASASGHLFSGPFARKHVCLIGVCTHLRPTHRTFTHRWCAVIVSLTAADTSRATWQKTFNGRVSIRIDFESALVGSTTIRACTQLGIGGRNVSCRYSRACRVQ